jgi:hypothetical protein
METLNLLDASPKHPWRLDQDWLRRLGARAAVMADDVRTLGRPWPVCVADDLVIAIALEQVLDAADLAVLEAHTVPTLEPTTATDPSAWDPARWFDPLRPEPQVMETDAVQHGCEIATSTTEGQR